MKILICFLAIYIIPLMIEAQEDMSVAWESKLGHYIIYHGTNLEDSSGSYSYAADQKEVTFFKNSDGSEIWSKAFKDLAPRLRRINELLAFWESNTLFLFDRKAGMDKVACVDMETGKLLWDTDKYQKLQDESIVYIPEEDGFAISLKDKLVFIKARTGEEVWSSREFKGVVGKGYYNEVDRSFTMVNFLPRKLFTFFKGFKNQIARIDMTNGKNLWQNSYVGIAEQKVLTKELIYDLEVYDDKVFLMMNGMQVFDYNNGSNLWSAAFDFTPRGVTNFCYGCYISGTYGVVADPITMGNYIYVLDMSNKRNQFVKKYDRHTGDLLWTSSEIEEAKAIPGLNVIGDKVVLQIGGRIEAQYCRNYTCGNSICHECAVKFPEKKPFGVQAFHDSDGSLAWESERFKKGITNSISFDKYYVVCSGKALYSININNGEEKYEVPVSKGGVGQASLILPYKEDIVIVVGEKGVSTFYAATGDLINSGKYKTALLHDWLDDLVILKTEKADIAVFDVDDCTYKEFKAKTGSSTLLTTDGEHVFVYEKKLVTKLKTR